MAGLRVPAVRSGARLETDTGARIGHMAARRRVRVVAVLTTVVLAACGAPDTETPLLPDATSTPAPTNASPTPSASTTPAPSTQEPSAPAPTEEPPEGVPEAWRGVDLEFFDTSRKVVALTFDGGASDAAVSSILGTLDRHDVPATFFVTGQFARAHPDSVRAMADAGHPVGNHSDTHPSFPDSTNAEIRAELTRADASISDLTGAVTAPLFRFPFGDRTPLDIEVVNDAGYIPFRWSADTLGWQGTDEGITTATVRDRVLATLRPGHIVLMHVGAHPSDGSTLDADALPGIIRDLQERGYDFVTIPEMLD